jgi:hypothetical protein
MTPAELDTTAVLGTLAVGTLAVNTTAVHKEH